MTLPCRVYQIYHLKREKKIALVEKIIAMEIQLYKVLRKLYKTRNNAARRIALSLFPFKYKVLPPSRLVLELAVGANSCNCV